MHWLALVRSAGSSSFWASASRSYATMICNIHTPDLPATVILMKFYSLARETRNLSHDRAKVDRNFGKHAARAAAAKEAAEENGINHFPVANSQQSSPAVSVRNSRPGTAMDVEDARRAPLKIYAYKSHFQPYRSWLGILATVLFAIFSGWWAFAGRFQVAGFVTSYIAVSSIILLKSGPVLRHHRMQFLWCCGAV